MKTGQQILEFMEDSGISQETMSNEHFCFQNLPAHFKDKVLRFAFDSLDEAILIEAIPGYGHFPALGYDYTHDPLAFLERLRWLIDVADESPADVLESEATIAAGLKVDELQRLLQTDQWECYGKIADAVNAYIQPMIAKRVDESVDLFINNREEALHVDSQIRDRLYSNAVSAQ